LLRQYTNTSVYLHWKSLTLDTYICRWDSYLLADCSLSFFNLLPGGQWDSVIGKWLLGESCRYHIILITIKIAIHSSYAKTNPKVLISKEISGFRDSVIPLK